MKCYIASPLFSQADQMFNARLAESLRKNFPSIEFYLPQENESLNDKSRYANSLMIANGDDNELLASDFMIAVLDGVDIDSGVACEIGKFHGFHNVNANPKDKKPIFGLFTDIRQHGRNVPEKINALIFEAYENQFAYRNLYVIGTIKQSGGMVVSSVYELCGEIEHYLKR